jgi:hypothetical protein
MLKSTNQRVGALAGFLLFVGAWLSAYYGQWLWAAGTAVIVAAALWLALDDQSEENTNDRVMKGLVSGLIMGVVARVLGALAMVWATGNWTSTATTTYSVFNDFLRVVLNGNVVSSIIMVALAGLAGAFVAYALPYFVAEREEA